MIGRTNKQAEITTLYVLIRGGGSGGGGKWGGEFKKIWYTPDSRMQMFNPVLLTIYMWVHY